MGVFQRTLFLSVAIVASLTLPARAEDTDIQQKGIHFSAQSITLKVGDRVRFQNLDDVTHNIMVIDSDDDAEDQGLQKPGVVITKKFDQEGTFQVRCAIHPKMKMTITVQH